MAVKYQIFVSSTYEDLKVERDRVIQGILELGHIPVGMEMFSAADEAQWQIIARHIRESDYYVVILAHRYGSREGDISFTRKEYEYAVEQGIPTIGFVLDPEASWPGDRYEKDPEAVALLDEFRALVKSKPVGFWSNADDLYGKANVALVKAMASQPRVGWVKASSALGPEVTAEISRLSSENAELRRKISSLEKTAEREAAHELTELWAQMMKNEWEYSARFSSGGDWIAADPITYSVLFRLLAPNMVAESSSEHIDDIIRVNTTREGVSEDEPGREKAIAIPINTRNAMLSNFVMLGLIEPSKRRHPVADKAVYWSLTEVGLEMLKLQQRRDFARGDVSEVREGPEAA
ncbi:hypothetical protein QE428_002644 [Microbacterium sp. SORGH_AS 505]|uniref:DUF4062 domain-containing protein n=1 Tax=Microbacterium sp. SORGH_AS_0505 TaxID=3041770 RepID=UPI002785E238|nr:DUF4062 domain-containing protein [Microbacterium sp. SORGH_AS_0505]MDQ1127611.1 hypothetical protein [Microbacterium sp. SORGH_AS_0505]